MNWITEQLGEFASDVIVQIIEVFLGWITGFFTKSANFANQSEIAGAVDAMALISFSLIVVMVGKEILNTYVLETDGDPDGDPMQLAVKTAQVVCYICANDFVYDVMKKFSELASDDMTVAVMPEKIFISMKNSIKILMPGVNLVLSIVFVVYLVCVIIFIVRAGIRGGELALMKIMWSFFALDKLTVSAERWNAFFSSYVKTFLGYIIQMIAFSLSFVTYYKYIVGDTSGNILTAIVWVIVALKTPDWLEKYIYSSGMSKVVRGGVGGAVSLSMLSRGLRR